MARRNNKPTGKKRSAKQNLKDRYSHAREDAQLAGLIPTTPEEALKDERRKSADQSQQPLPDLIGQAIRKGWATPDEKKPALVDEMVQIVQNEEESGAVKVMAYNALRAGDKDQWERDNPELSGKARGQTQVAVGVQVNNGVDLAALMRAVDDSLERSKRLGDADSATADPSSPEALVRDEGSDLAGDDPVRQAGRGGGIDADLP